jgi:hypothetical protein
MPIINEAEYRTFINFHGSAFLAPSRTLKMKEKSRVIVVRPWFS